MFFAKLTIRFVDGLEKLGEARRFIDRPKARETVTEHVDIALG
jgi:hypothetical protein